MPDCSLTARAVVACVSGDGHVTLKLDEARCPGCAGTCLWRRLRRRSLSAPFAAGDIAPGTAVELSLPERYVLYGSLAVYGLPLLGLLAGAATGAFVTGSDPGVVVGAVAGVGLVYLFTPRLRRRIEEAALRQVRVKRLS
jgi:positive regulator of sigma E activity